MRRRVASYIPQEDDYIEGDLGALERRIEASDLCYQLADLGPRAQHFFGWVLGEFFELVLIDRPTGRVELIVASSD